MDELDSVAAHGASEEWDAQDCASLIDQLTIVRKGMLDLEASLLPALRQANPTHSASAVNLAHYLAMRRFSMKRLQDGLAGFGVSSLGGSEAQVLAKLDKVIGILHRLAGRAWHRPPEDELVRRQSDPALLTQHSLALFGVPSPQRAARIMVTLPSEAADDDEIAHGLVDAGMDVARIDCACDSAARWEAMAARVRKAARRAGREVRVLMDLAGPKMQTGPVACGPAVLKLKPVRDACGCVTAPGRLGLRPVGASASIAGATVHLGVDAAWLQRPEEGDRIDVTDARSAHRRLVVVARCPEGLLVECSRTVYLTAETRLRYHRRGHGVREALPSDLPSAPGRISLRRGEVLHLVAKGLGHNATVQTAHQRALPATIACTLPEALTHVRRGDQVWFDKGRIGGVVLKASSKGVEVQITHTRDEGDHLCADAGISLPDTRLELSALAKKDVEALATVARHADLVGLSCAQSADDVKSLRRQLVELGAAHLGIILKVDTRRGFEHLPEMLFAVMAFPAAGVMISRGDLAIECGYERMAEVQEEILQACEAAHMPTVWTSQVLETLTRMDPQSRAEIPDAAMGEWAECVVLNRGPHIIEAIRTLDGILRRMRPHHIKMQPLMRAPNTRTSPQETVEAVTLARGARGEKGPRPQALKPARSGRPTRIDAIA